MKPESRFHRNSEHLGCTAGLLQAAGRNLPAVQAHISPCTQQMPSRHPHIAQCKQRHRLRRVLGQPFVANLCETLQRRGGGMVSALVAARRDDVLRLVTVAGNLDTHAWARLHRISPLTGSLNPSEARAQLAHLRQVHFSGATDQVVPPAMAKTFAAGFCNSPATRSSGDRGL